MDRIGDLKMAMDNGDLDIDLLFPMMMVDSVVGVVGKMMTVKLIGCGIKNFDLFEIHQDVDDIVGHLWMTCLLYTSPSPRDQRGSRMPSSA